MDRCTFDVYFDPKAPAGKEVNWIETVPGTILHPVPPSDADQVQSFIRMT